jgi:hypothetical protein
MLQCSNFGADCETMATDGYIRMTAEKRRLVELGLKAKK